MSSLVANKPRCVFIEASASDALRDPDCLSIVTTVFRNGGATDAGVAKPFIELTPELLALLQAIYGVPT